MAKSKKEAGDLTGPKKMRNRPGIGVLAACIAGIITILI